ncbi:MAG: 30S ribosome-binding factor RbfA [Patescibacteria group bacterium]
MKKLDNASFSTKAPSSAIRRLPRLESVLRHELGQIMTREMEWPLGTLVTLSQVEVLADLSAVRVGLSVLPFSMSEKVLSVAIRTKSNLQRIINKKLKVYRVPKIEFFIDEAAERGDHIERLLDSIREE